MNRNEERRPIWAAFFASLYFSWSCPVPLFSPVRLPALLLLATGCSALDIGNPYANRALTRPTEIVGGNTFRQVSAGFFHTCGITAAGTAYCWGSNEYLQLGTNAALRTCEIRSCSMIPVAVLGGRAYTQVAAGITHSCGLAVGGRIYCWGGAYPMSPSLLGDGVTTQSATPVLVAADSAFVTISIGNGLHSCALTASGVAYCWGQNASGQLGDSSKVARATPVRVADGLRFRRISAGAAHTCAIALDASLHCWGSNRYGQLGLGEVPYNSFNFARIHPGRVVGNRMWSSIAAGGEHTCATSDANQAFCWGQNDNAAQLGDDQPITHRGVPGPVTGSIGFDSLAAGTVSTCGHTSTGELHCWGSNYFGALGNGQTATGGIGHPVRVLGGLYVAVTVGGSHSCGVTSNGKSMCWGDAFYGQTGTGAR